MTVIVSKRGPSRLTLVEAHTRLVLLGGEYPRWLSRYRCHCGTELEALEGNVATGNTRSCGCLRAETSAANGRKCKGRPRRRAW